MSFVGGWDMEKRQAQINQLAKDIRDLLVELGDRKSIAKVMFELPFIADTQEAAFIAKMVNGYDWRVRFSPKLKLSTLKQMTTVTLIKTRKLLK